MIFRELGENDLDDISEIFQLIYNDKRRPEDYQKWLEYPKYCRNLVVERRKKVIGRLLLDEFNPFYPEIVNFAIHPKYQEKGIGTRLLSYAIQISFESKQNGLVIPHLKNEYNNPRVKQFYNQMNFIPVIKGNNTLNEWRMYFKNYSPILALEKSTTPNKLTISSILTKPNNNFKREYEFRSEKQNELIEHIQQCRTKNFICFENNVKEKVHLMVTGQPNQPIGQIDGDFCIPGLNPTVIGIKMINKRIRLIVKFQNVEEFGECELYLKIIGNEELLFNIIYLKQPNIAIKGLPGELALSSNEEIIYKLKLKMGNKFDSNLFNYTSFETVPLTIIFKDSQGNIPPFQLTLNFWYRLIN